MTKWSLWHYDLTIYIEDSLTPLLGPIYLLSPTELCTLQDFIEENIKVSLIQPSRSPYGTLVLFVKKKKMGSSIYA